MSSDPNTSSRARLVAHVFKSAPVSPPAALVTPKLRTIVQSTSRRNRTKRIDVPMKWGIDTAATATFAPVAAAMAGVSRLPMPKPATDATAPPKRAAAKMSSSNRLMFCEHACGAVFVERHDVVRLGFHVRRFHTG